MHYCAMMFFTPAPMMIAAHLIRSKTIPPLCFAADLSEGYRLLAVGGVDRVAFLQGLLTQDLLQLSPTHAQFAALLTAGGKFLADMLALSDGERVYLRLAAGEAEGLCKRLALYKLRSQVTLELLPPASCVVYWTDNPDKAEELAAVFGLEAKAGACRWVLEQRQTCYLVDPRYAGLGVLQITLDGQPDMPAPVQGFTASTAAAHRYHQLGLLVPEGAVDLEQNRSVILEYGYDRLSAIDWHKGCYVGQELMARTHHLGQLRKGLYVLEMAEDAQLPAGTEVLAGETAVGEVRGVAAAPEAGGVSRVLGLLKHDLLAEALTHQQPLSAAGYGLRLISDPPIGSLIINP